MNKTVTFTVDFDAVHCNPAHLKSTGKGWARKLRELGASEAEAEALRKRLCDGMAATIELSRIKALAGIGEEI